MKFNLGEGGGNFTPCWFSPNNSEMLKNLILQSVGTHQNHPCQLWYLLPTPVPKYWTNLGRGNFFYNFRNNICKEFEARSKLMIREIQRGQKIDINVLSTTYNIIAISQVFTRSGAIRKPDFGRMVHELSIFISTNFLTKTKNTTKKTFNTSLMQFIRKYLHLWLKTCLSCKECWRLNAKMIIKNVY